MNKKLFFNFKSIPFILLSLFVILGVLVCNFVQITELDTKIIIFLQNSLSDINLDVFKFLSKFHNRYVNVIMFFVIFFLVYKKDYGLAFMSFISEYTRNDVILFIKDIFQRHRPPIELQPYSHPQDYSFPSGHSYNIVILAGILICIISKYVKNKIIRYILSSVCIVIAIFVGLSRLMLGVHYPTDVLAGFLLGATVVTTIWIINTKYNN